MRFQPLSLLILLALNARAADDFKPLYNGKDLAGLPVKDALPGVNVWRANGEILLDGKGETDAGGWLTTDQTNGVETLRLNLDNVTVLHGHHRQYQPVRESARRGHLGLQGDRGEPVEFRNLMIKELP